MASTEPDPSTEPPTEPVPDEVPHEVLDDPDSPGLAAMKPLDDPSRSDAEPNEPA